MTQQPAAGIIDSVTAYLDQKLERFGESLDEALATGDAEAVHGLRVASRRLHEPLTLLEGWVRPRDLKAAKRELKRLRGAFREVRDLDVLSHSVTAAVPGDSARLAELEARLADRRTKAFEAAARRSRKLKPQQTLAGLRGIRRVLMGPGAGADDESLRRRMHERLGMLSEALIKCDPRGEGGDLHPARLQAKRLRYCAELAGLTEAPTGPLVDALAAMQNLLGHWNDQVTAARWLARLGRRRSVLTRDAGWSAELLQQAAGRARSAEAQRGHILHAWAALDAHLRVWRLEPPDAPAAGTADDQVSFLPEGCGGEIAATGLVIEPVEQERVEENVEHV